MRSMTYNVSREQLLAISFAKKLSTCQKHELCVNGCTDREILKILTAQEKQEYYKELDWLESNQTVAFGHIFYGDEDYPDTLSRYDSPVFRLAYIGAKPKGFMGNISKAESLTIVGTRQTDEEGRRASYLMGLECAKNDIVVYSGYASGIDRMSHRGCVDGAGATFAIMPCGLSHSYAFRENELRAKIFENGGGFISQFGANEEPMKWNFHYRNRILALISDATLVVQAPSSSGALITVRDALDDGKDVFVSKAGIGSSENRQGTTKLVEDGAVTISAYEDLSKYTFGAFKIKNRLKEIEFSQAEKIIKSAEQAVYRYVNRYYILNPAL